MGTDVYAVDQKNILFGAERPDSGLIFTCDEDNDDVQVAPTNRKYMQEHAAGLIWWKVAMELSRYSPCVPVFPAPAGRGRNDVTAWEAGEVGQE